MDGVLSEMTNQRSLWAEIKGQISTGGTAVGVCCRPHQQEKAGKVILRQVEKEH